MSTTEVYPVTRSTWIDVVREAAFLVDQNFPDDLTRYLTFLLMRFQKDSNIVSFFAVDMYRRSLESRTLSERRNILEYLGGACLIRAGFFPEKRRVVSVKYFLGMGASAYGQLSDISGVPSRRELYARIGSNFIALVEVLHEMRELGGRVPSLDVALELSEYGSSRALRKLDVRAGDIQTLSQMQ